MSDVAIRINGISKRYRIGGPGAKYKTLRDTIAGAGKALSQTRQQKEAFWALKDVSFDVNRGDVVGLIGRNGAGKSTLLKILTRITEPTEGYVDIKGRVGSLLEVGTGFHPELSGRENIYLNGAILGMGRRETEKKFDDIVEFAEVTKFIDTPVKHYSSGMYLRLAFAVAAHLESEILLVDEVLAVGDAAFQNKCLGKMGDVAAQGRTVIFVSHNLAAIMSLCSSCAYLAGGQLIEVGQTDAMVRNYLAGTAAAGDQDVTIREGKAGAPMWMESVTVEELTQDGQSRSKVRVRLRCKAIKSLPFTVAWHLSTNVGQRLAYGSQEHFRRETLQSTEGSFDVLLEIDEMPLGAGHYYLDLELCHKKSKTYYDIYERAATFAVTVYDPYSIGWNYEPKGEYGPLHFPSQAAIVS